MYNMYPDYSEENHEQPQAFNHRASAAELAKWGMGNDLEDLADFVDARRVAAADRHVQADASPSPRVQRGAGYISVRPMVVE